MYLVKLKNTLIHRGARWYVHLFQDRESTVLEEMEGSPRNCDGTASLNSLIAIVVHKI